MASLNLLILLSFLYIVDGYVTVNVYEEGQDKDVTNAIPNVTHCEYHICEEFCKQLGYRGGSCIGNHCKCDVRGTEESDRNYDTRMNDCNPSTCEQMCQRMGFTGGDCINNRCQCDKFVTDDSNDIDVPILRGCNLRECEQRCRRLGFPGGVCVGDRCKCDNFRSLGTVEDAADVIPLHGCNLRACEQLCRRLGFPGGVCVGDRCKCDNFRSPETTSVLDSAKINSEYRSCNYRECDRRCRRLKFPGGACVNSYKCDNFRQLLSINEHKHNEVFDSVMYNLSSHCEAQDCKTSRGIEGKRAIGSLDDNSASYTTGDSPLEKDVKCDSTVCETRCKQRELSTGICIQGECYCDMEEAEPETPSLRACDVVACNDMCHRMNYIGGMCRGNSCVCY